MPSKNLNTLRKINSLYEFHDVKTQQFDSPVPAKPKPSKTGKAILLDIYRLLTDEAQRAYAEATLESTIEAIVLKNLCEMGIQNGPLNIFESIRFKSG